jgi:hypothetical protein
MFRRDAKNPKLAKLARVLLDLDILKDADAPDLPHATESTLVERAITEWSSQATGGGLTVLKEVRLVVNPDAVAEVIEACEDTGADAPENIDPESHVVFALCPWDGGDAWVLERKCADIEARAPGLAQTALSLLDRALWRSAVGMTPCFAREAADEFLYGWWDDELDDRDRGLSKADFEAGIPKWVYSPQRKLSRVRLQRLAWKDEVARATLALMDALNDKRATPPTCGMDHTVFSVVLRWSPNDPVVQIFHDLVNMNQNSGMGHEDYGWFFVPIQHKAAERALDGIRRMLHTLGCADRLISQLAEAQR